MSDYESVLADAAQLPVAQRVRLIEALWDTVPDDELPPLSEEWLAEIERRSADFDSGNATAIPWSEVQANALQRLDSGGD